MPKRNNRPKFVVTLTRPEGASTESIREYIEDAVASWKGQLFPGDEEREGDPLFELDGNSVKVSLYRKRPKSKQTHPLAGSPISSRGDEDDYE